MRWARLEATIHTFTPIRVDSEEGNDMSMPSNREPSGWAVGWIGFAAFLMLMMGIWWIIAGFVALVDDTFYVVTNEYIFKFDVTTWGWIHLILGVVVLLASFGLFTGAVWARIVGVLIAFVAGLVAFAWLPWYPFWAIMFIIASVGVIWALTMHGRDIAES
jgi:hypothetical protein